MLLLLLLVVMLTGCSSNTSVLKTTENQIVADPVVETYFKCTGPTWADGEFTEIPKEDITYFQSIAFVNTSMFDNYAYLDTDTYRYKSDLDTAKILWCATKLGYTTCVDTQSDTVLDFYLYDDANDKYFTAKDYIGVLSYAKVPKEESNFTACGRVLDKSKDLTLFINNSKLKFTISEDLMDYVNLDSYITVEGYVTCKNSAEYDISYLITKINETTSESVSSNHTEDFVPEVGYFKIKPLSYVMDDEQELDSESEYNTAVERLRIKEGGLYTTPTIDDSEIIYLAYWCGLDVYIHTSSDNIYNIDDYVIVDDNKPLDLQSSDDLMNYINAKYLPSNTHPTMYTDKYTLAAISSHINSNTTISGINSDYKDDCYSYHYAVLKNKDSTLLARFTSNTKGIGYNTLADGVGSTYKISCFPNYIATVDDSVYHYELLSIERSNTKK